MHELSLAQNLLDIILAQRDKAPFAKVKTVTVSIGRLSHVEPEALSFCFNSVVKNTCAEQADLTIVPVDSIGRCRRCGHETVMEELYAPCPLCNEFDLQIISGRDVELTSIEVVD